MQWGVRKGPSGFAGFQSSGGAGGGGGGQSQEGALSGLEARGSGRFYDGVPNKSQ